MIVQVPAGSGIERRLRAAPPASVASGRIAVEEGPADAEGYLEPAPGGRMVLSVPAPEALERDAADVRRVLGLAHEGEDPLVVEVEVGEELREEELAAVLAGAEHARRTVVVRVIRSL